MSKWAPCSCITKEWPLRRLGEEERKHWKKYGYWLLRQTVIAFLSDFTFIVKNHDKFYSLFLSWILLVQTLDESFLLFSSIMKTQLSHDNFWLQIKITWNLIHCKLYLIFFYSSHILNIFEMHFYLIWLVQLELKELTSQF